MVQPYEGSLVSHGRRIQIEKPRLMGRHYSQRFTITLDRLCRMNPLQGSSEIRHGCSLPPYNAQNFNSASASVYNILQVAAYTQPSYPLPPGADARQITLQTANVSYFNTLNQKTQAAKTANLSGAPYPSFKTESERLMYVQGQAATAARNRFTGQNPSLPAGVPCSSIYGIINS